MVLTTWKTRQKSSRDTFIQLKDPLATFGKTCIDDVASFDAFVQSACLQLRQ
jgi:hypothetical protein